MNNTRHYETTIIINGALEEEPIAQVVTRTSEFITRNGGDIKNADHWGRRRLAYPINKKNNGYYVQFTVDGPAELIEWMKTKAPRCGCGSMQWDVKAHIKEAPPAC